MTKENLANEIVNKFQNSLKDNKFILFISSDYYRVGVIFKKEENHIVQNFRFLIQKSLSVKKIYGFEKNIAFLDIEKIIVPILGKNNLVASDADYKNQLQTFKIVVEDNNQLPAEGRKIEKEEDIEYVAELFIKFYKEKALPFFEKWKDLTVLYEYIKDKTEEELWDILGQFAPMKKAVILRLCNDINYQEFMNDYYEKQKEYYEEDPEDIDNIRYYNAAKELKEVLDKTAPIYNV
ncbi:hypothetical protein MWN41_05735 [Ornithobacterium rhinotracheale]|uniref:hypothetical protein n=1 Tax=Ornithobacterium rhinotracheale TaxID=28251 RepID=UPI001FF1D596|nr:hypothetical protein [Ornithobacterium rhinotracheale]MCK0202517.1 hypothetical protein [Ornithobacterium rhinotracheale]